MLSAEHVAALEDEAALLLESARTYRPEPDAHAGPIYPLLSVLLLTGGPTSEVFGLQWTT